jgi:prepilin-type N-terminal cleavage/methylation domain-containing protein
LKTKKKSQYNILKKNKKGLSLAEILIAMVILAIVAAGIFASFIAGNRFSNRAKRRMAAINIGRYIIEDLYKNVRADTWINTSNLLSCGDDNNNYPCTKSTPGDFSLPPINSNSPLKDFDVTAYLYIDLDGDKATDPDCYLDCPRIVTVRIEWTE